jgi:alpha-L-fucosidase
MISPTRINRRQVLGVLAAGAPALGLPRALAQPAAGTLEIAPGPFKGTRESLRDYQIPDWYRDAKFGIWAHWGPQSHAEFGDWYARLMYIQNSPQYKHHVATYGHPSKFGYKDLALTWRGENFDPEHLIGMYRKAGAKYFCSMGVHHDNFDLWNSKFQPVWNAAASGPKKDIVGLWAKAARKNGLKFAVSEHLAVSYHWFQTSHRADKTGPLAGVPYDGADPANVALYHETHDVPRDAGGEVLWSPVNVSPAWKRRYFDRIKDLIDHYEPDLMYIDGPIFFDEIGLSLVAHQYNLSAKKHGGVPQTVYTSKRREDSEVGTCVLDVERGVVESIWPRPWQTDTCIGQWHYNKGEKYKSAKTVIDMLVDIVSRNGNLMLNFPLNSKGELDADELKVLDSVTKWMAVNSEGIYATRPWKIYGYGPATAVSAQKGTLPFNENQRKNLSAADVRFTKKGDTLYAFCMGLPEQSVVIEPLGTKSPQNPGKVQHVTLLGLHGSLKFRQDETGLHIDLPAQKPALPEEGVTFKIVGA